MKGREEAREVEGTRLNCLRKELLGGQTRREEGRVLGIEYPGFRNSWFRISSREGLFLWVFY